MKISRRKLLNRIAAIKHRMKINFGGLREIVLERDNYSCVKCGMSDAEHRKRWNCSITVDHIDGFGSRSVVKHNTLDNLQTLCRPCHAHKDAIKTLNDKDVVEIRELSKLMTNKDIAKKFHIHRNTVWRVLARVSWNHVP